MEEAMPKVYKELSKSFYKVRKTLQSFMQDD